jgi:Tfp pilus assembly protein PilO
MSQLTPREKKLLAGCILVLVTMASVILLKTYLDSKRTLEQKITTLQTESADNASWLKEADFHNKRSQWLRQTLPQTESLGRATGTLLEEVQKAALDNEFKILRSTLNTPAKTPHYDEVAIQINLRGDMPRVLAWLSSLQSPERFMIVKSLELEQDSRAKEKIPQLFANITLARWFKPGA